MERVIEERVIEVITRKEISTWDRGDYILISTPTGSGKNHFVYETLCPYCDENRKSMLILTNRNLLKEQIEKEKEKKELNIKVMTYQELEVILKNDGDIVEYDYIISDESHYFFTDSTFNRKTDISLEWLMRKNQDSIKLLLTATSKLIEKYIVSVYNIILYKYHIERNYDYIEKLYFYDDYKPKFPETDDNNSKPSEINEILKNIPDGEKVMYFTSCEKAYSMYKKYKNSAFVCSEHNTKYSKHSSTKIRKEIIEFKKFSCKYLFCTSALDNGVSIEDTAVKHIIIDYFDFTTMIQCLGRRRIDNTIDNDTIKLYIKNRNSDSIVGSRIKYEFLIKQSYYLLEYGIAAFCKEYGKTLLSELIDLVYEDDKLRLEVNKPMLANYEYLLEQCYKSSDTNFVEQVCKELLISYNKVFISGKKHDTILILECLNKLKGVKLFKDEQMELKAYFIKELTYPLSLKMTNTYVTINKYLAKNNIKYKFVTKQYNKKPKRNKNYWILEEIKYIRIVDAL